MLLIFFYSDSLLGNEKCIFVHYFVLFLSAYTHLIITLYIFWYHEYFITSSLTSSRFVGFTSSVLCSLPLSRGESEVLSWKMEAAAYLQNFLMFLWQLPVEFSVLTWAPLFRLHHRMIPSVCLNICNQIVQPWVDIQACMFVCLLMLGVICIPAWILRLPSFLVTNVLGVSQDSLYPGVYSTWLSKLLKYFRLQKAKTAVMQRDQRTRIIGK